MGTYEINFVQETMIDNSCQSTIHESARPVLDKHFLIQQLIIVQDVMSCSSLDSGDDMI